MTLHEVRKGRGRPPSPDDERQSRPVMIYLTPHELDRLKRATAVSRQSYSAFIRDVLADGISETIGDEDA
jgi:hypothetical protein